jgi:serine/threonine protein kinase
MVVSANDTQDGQEVAIKKMILRDHLTYSKRALREIKILSRLDHECIVPIIELIADSNPSAIQEVYVVMRRMESDLHQASREYPCLTALVNLERAYISIGLVHALYSFVGLTLLVRLSTLTS